MRITALIASWLALGCAAGPSATRAQAGPAPPPSPPVVLRWEAPPLPPAEPIAASEFAARRQALLASAGDGVVVVFGSPAPAFDYLPYAQEQDFRYLTGITEPGAAWIAATRGGRTEEMLFVQPADPAREVWEGARLGTDGALALTGIPARENHRFTTVLDSLVRLGGPIHTTTVPAVQAGLGVTLTHGQQVLEQLRASHPGLEVRMLQGRIRQQRAMKSDAELDRIRRAVHISVVAQREAMRAVRPGLNEFEIRGLLEYVYVRNGAEGPAYAPIVGSGPNSTTLHYRAADRFMQDGEVLLIDAAASYGGYAADVTRTFPVNGRFSPEQRAIYEVVLAAQKAAESQIRLGASWADLTEAANRELAAGMARLGLIDAPTATYDCGAAGAGAICPQYRIFYMHGLGHGVGLAVHDPDISESPTGFQPGSAVTIEPGIYVRADAFDHLPQTAANHAMIARLRPALQRYMNIGVRIEDVFIFDRNGVERVSRGVPREIEEIEALMREPSYAEPGRRPEMVEWYRLNRGR
jgi:Xaa-Pro aminopeptidase